MSNDAMQEYFKAIAEQEDEGGAGGGDFFRVGKYKATLKKAEARKGYKGFSLIFSFRIDQALKTGADEPNVVGSTAKVIFKTNDSGKKGTMAKINSQRLVRAFFNLPEKTPAAKLLETLTLLTHANQPGRGMAIECEAYSTTTEAGKQIVACSFSHDPSAMDPAEIQRRRAELDTGK